MTSTDSEPREAWPSRDPQRKSGRQHYQRGMNENLNHRRRRTGSGLVARAAAGAHSSAVAASVDLSSRSCAMRRVSVLAGVGWNVTILTTSSMTAKMGSTTRLLVRVIDASIAADRRKRVVSSSLA